MSTDYSKMIDTEIAQKVFFWLSNDFFPKGGLAHINNDGFFFFDNGNVKRKFDPCNNPADAWQIIVANNIDIIQDNGQGCALATNSAIQMFQGDDVHISQDENPLRAAMIVFLMMQEEK